ncbi:MAG: hypothetical protein NTU80_00940 [Verrucomicrobia bacterium]|nr:hypothetical protein [Verrucomicrobiota bacterium]
MSFLYFEKHSTTHPRREVVFFSSQNSITTEEAYQSIDAYFTAAPIPDAVFFLGFEYNLASLIAAITNNRVANRIRTTASTPPNLAYFSKSGALLGRQGVNYETNQTLPEELINTLRSAGAMHIFKKHKGMLESSDSHHYIKPSLKHTDKFIRTGNVLCNSQEVDFLAAWTLRWISPNLNYIYTDSSTITSLAYASILLIAKLNAGTPPAISVRCFESYHLLRNFEFIDIRKSLVYVSASTDGAMLASLNQEHGISSEQLITVYYLGKKPPVGNVICDLTRSASNPDGYEPALVTQPECRGQFAPGSFAVHITSESFLPENPVIKEIPILVKDIPNDWDVVKQHFIGNSSVKCHVRCASHVDSTRPQRQTVALDIAPALTPGSVFYDKYCKILKGAIPMHLSFVIYLEDSASVKMKQILHGFLPAQHRKKVKFIAAAKFTKANGAMLSVKKEQRDATLVIASSLLDGTRLLDIAQILRDRQKNHNLTYVIGISGCRDAAETVELKSNLQYCQSKPNYSLLCVEEFHVSRDKQADTTPWNTEIEFWRSVLPHSKWFTKFPDARKIIAARLATLERVDRDYLPEDDLFLPRSLDSHGCLTLRPNSVFTEGLCVTKFSQADVFLAASKLLHEMRTRASPKAKLAQHPHMRAVLSPKLFFRFSDGVIQAAFLRASHPEEFDYRMDAELSKAAAGIISNILSWPSNPRAEALTEFLYAIATDKLRLLKPDRLGVVSIIEQRLPKRHHLERLLCEFIRSK